MEERNLSPGETGLAEELDQVASKTVATGWQRFFNYIIDNLFISYGLTFLTGRLLARLLVDHFPDLAYEYFVEEDALTVFLVSYVFSSFHYIFYYTIAEKAFRGYTLGKLITGTRALRQDGTELTFKDSLLRSLVRMVPFEPFSGFADRPWHDSWTKTTVIQTR